MLSPTSFWRQPLPDDAPIDATSGAVVANLASQAATFATLLTREYGASFFIASASCPTQKVTVDWKEYESTKGLELQAMFEEVPIPPEFRPPGPAREDDNHSIIYQPSTDTIWEMWRVSQYSVDGAHEAAWSWVTGVPSEVLNAPGWHIGNGIKITEASKCPGYSPISTLGPTATRLLTSGGAIFPEEARRLYIPHALMATAELRKTLFRWPAQATDGTNEGASYPESGSLFRFPPTMSFEGVSDPFMQAVCTAIRDYGFVIFDTGTTVAIKCINRATVRGAAPGTYTTTTDPWRGSEDKVGGANAILRHEPGGASGSGALAQQIPWAELELVDASYRPSDVARKPLL